MGRLRWKITSTGSPATRTWSIPFAWQDMTYTDKVYGLPYYADTITFMYNAKILEDAGITAPPQTWDEVTEQALDAQRGRHGAPVRRTSSPTPCRMSVEAFASMVFGRGGELIDEELNPLWTDPESPAAQQLHWLVDAKNEHDILAIMDHETTIVPGHEHRAARLLGDVQLQPGLTEQRRHLGAGRASSRWR